jgi:hypothetical protein
MSKRVVMHMLCDEQGHEHVAIAGSGHTSSSSDRTSSEVTTRPTVTSGNPVLGSVDVKTVLVPPSPRCIRSTTVWLNVRRVSRPIASACLCRSSGRSIIVRAPKFNSAAS